MRSVSQAPKNDASQFEFPIPMLLILRSHQGLAVNLVVSTHHLHRDCLITPVHRYTMTIYLEGGWTTWTVLESRHMAGLHMKKGTLRMAMLRETDKRGRESERENERENY